MIKRSTDDRRIKKIKVKEDRRKSLRRHDDISNAKSYYFIVTLMGFLLFSVGISSYLLQY